MPLSINIFKKITQDLIFVNSRAHDINYYSYSSCHNIEENLGTLRTPVYVIDIYFTNMDQDEVVIDVYLLDSLT